MKQVISFFFCTIVFCSLKTTAQVNTVEFGKNRLQFQKFNWKYYQTENFNTYFSQDGLALGKYVAQIAEEVLPGIEEFVEYGLQRRANIIVYNNFDEFQQSNIGIGIDWQVVVEIDGSGVFDDIAYLYIWQWFYAINNVAMAAGFVVVAVHQVDAGEFELAFAIGHSHLIAMAGGYYLQGVPV